VSHEIPVTWDDWRPGDQRVFIADTRKTKRELGWEPKINVKTGVSRLFAWVNENRELV